MTPDRSTSPAIHPFGKLSMPEQTTETLSNGAELHYYTGGDQPVCRLSILIPGGTLDLGNARAKLLAGMLTEGSTEIDADTLAEITDFNGARTGASAHSHHITFDMAVTTSRLTAMLGELRKMFAVPLFPESRLALLRDRLKNNVRMSKMEVANATDEAFLPLIVGASHPQSRVLSEEEIDATDSETLRQTYNDIFNPSQIHAYFCGLAGDEEIEAVREFISGLPELGKGITASVQPYEPAGAQSRRDVPFAGSMQCGIAAGMPGPSRTSADYVPLRYAVMCLGGYFGSRLMTNIREDKGLTYGISAALLGSPEGSYVYISTTADRSYAEAVEREIRAELDALRTNPPRGAELDRFKRYAATQLAEMLDNPQSIMGYYSSMLLVGTPADYFERQQEVLSQLSPEMISEIADRYLRPEFLRIATAGSSTGENR